jgi:hypothetical protein
MLNYLRTLSKAQAERLMIDFLALLSLALVGYAALVAF